GRRKCQPPGNAAVFQREYAKARWFRPFRKYVAASAVVGFGPSLLTRAESFGAQSVTLSASLIRSVVGGLHERRSACNPAAPAVAASGKSSAGRLLRARLMRTNVHIAKSLCRKDLRRDFSRIFPLLLTRLHKYGKLTGPSKALRGALPQTAPDKDE